MQFLRAAQESPGWLAENTIPGLSSRLMCASRLICCTDLVMPGAFPTCATLARFRLLIRELLPTLGSPTMPERPQPRHHAMHTHLSHRGQSPLQIVEYMLQARACSELGGLQINTPLHILHAAIQDTSIRCIRMRQQHSTTRLRVFAFHGLHWCAHPQ